MDTESKFRFFITHSWRDNAFAQKLCDDLRANGFAGFLDVYSIHLGDDIPREINRGLEECDVYIPILSFDALKSKWCEHEINAAITLGKESERNGRPTIIPILAEDCRSALPPLLKPLRYVNFAGRYQAAVEELLAGIKALDFVSTPTIISVGTTSPEPILPMQRVRQNYAPMIAAGVAVGVLMVLCLVGVLWQANSVSATPTVRVALATETRAPTATQIVVVPTETMVPIATVLPTQQVSPTATRTRTAMATLRTPTLAALASKQLATPQPTPTLQFRSVRLKDTLLLFSSPIGIPSPGLSGGYLSNNKQVLISEGDLNQQTGIRRIWIKAAVRSNNLAGNTLRDPGGSSVILSSTIEKYEVGLLKEPWPAQLVGENATGCSYLGFVWVDDCVLIVLEAWAEERVIRLSSP